MNDSMDKEVHLSKNKITDSEIWSKSIQSLIERIKKCSIMNFFKL